MDQRTLLVRWMVQLGLWLTCGLFIIACFTWWLLPAYAPRWFGQVADAIPLLTRPIASRLYEYGKAEYLICADLRTTDSIKSKAAARNAYHPLHEAARIYGQLSEAAPDDKALEAQMHSSNQLRYAVKREVWIDIPP